MKYSLEEILEFPVTRFGDQESLTIRTYLLEVFLKLWDKPESFSGKRPFGISDWSFDLYNPLIEMKIVEGTFDNMGFIASLDEKAADKIIRECIQEIFKKRA